MMRNVFVATRPLALVLLAVAAGSAAGCGENPLKLEFTVDKDIPEQQIPGSLALCQVPIAVGVLGTPFDVTMSQEEDFPEQDTDVQYIESARLRRFSLSLTDASAETTWDFLETLSIFIEANGHERRLIAWIGSNEDPIPAGLTTLDLERESVNLARYVKADGGFTMTSEATGCNPQQNATFDGEIRIRIVADPL